MVMQLFLVLQLFINASLVHATAVATAIAFFKIEKTAGYWMIPYALWTGFYALVRVRMNPY